jgi:Ca2+-binding RTX toxin-like protein
MRIGKILVALAIAATPVAVSVTPSNASVPTCNGKPATIVGNPANTINFYGSTVVLIQGTPGNDVIVGTSGNDLIFGGAGNDTICGRDGNDAISGDDGADYIAGNAGNDLLLGGRGNDLILGGPGNDTIDLGTGTLDAVSYVYDGSALTAKDGYFHAGNNDSDTVTNYDAVIGTNHNDFIVVGADQYATGLAGDDYLVRPVGWIDGALGDHLSGGSGNNHCFLEYRTGWTRADLDYWAHRVPCADAGI